MFESYYISLKIGTVAGLYTDLKTWRIMVVITMTTTCALLFSSFRTWFIYIFFPDMVNREKIICCLHESKK